MSELQVTHHITIVNGLKMHYVEAGQGPPLLLLHGFPETWYAWRHQIPVLAQRSGLSRPTFADTALQPSPLPVMTSAPWRQTSMN